jgi:hypothetical protein
MKNILRTLQLTVSVVLVLLLVSASAGKIDLKYNLTIGNTYKMSTSADQTIEMNMMGQQQTMKNKMEGVTAFKVQGLEKNVYTLDTWFEKLKMVMETPMGAINMDSDTANSADPGSKIFGKLMNKHFTVKMQTNGKVTEVVGADKMMEAAFSNITDMDEMQLSMIKESVKKLASNEAIKGNIEGGTYFFPDKPVSIGDTWNNKMDISSGMNAQLDNNWKLTDSKNGVSFLECKGKLQTKENAVAQNMNGISVKYNFTGEQLTVSQIDEKTGWIIESTVNQTISGDMVADMSSQGGGVQKIPMKISGKTITKGIK